MTAPTVPQAPSLKLNGYPRDELTRLRDAVRQVRAAAREWDVHCVCTCQHCVTLALLILRHIGGEP